MPRQLADGSTSALCLTCGTRLDTVELLAQHCDHHHQPPPPCAQRVHHSRDDAHVACDQGSHCNRCALDFTSQATLETHERTFHQQSCSGESRVEDHSVQGAPSLTTWFETIRSALISAVEYTQNAEVPVRLDDKYLTVDQAPGSLISEFPPLPSLRELARLAFVDEEIARHALVRQELAREELEREARARAAQAFELMYREAEARDALAKEKLDRQTRARKARAHQQYVREELARERREREEHAREDVERQRKMRRYREENRLMRAGYGRDRAVVEARNNEAREWLAASQQVHRGREDRPRSTNPPAIRQTTNGTWAGLFDQDHQTQQQSALPRQLAATRPITPHAQRPQFGQPRTQPPRIPLAPIPQAAPVSAPATQRRVPQQAPTTTGRPGRASAPPFRCDRCSREFSSRHALDQHHRALHARNAIPEPVARAREIPDAPRYTCISCHRTFINQYALDQHLVSNAHPENQIDGQPGYRCTECGVVFGTRDLLTLHAAEHVGQRMRSG